MTKLFSQLVAHRYDFTHSLLHTYPIFLKSLIPGNGGFGEVYRGYLDKPGAPSVAVAIKETKHERLNGMFVEEAEVMAQLDHRNVLKILAITKDEDITKIVLEFMEEKDLFSAIMAVRKLLFFSS